MPSSTVGPSLLSSDGARVMNIWPSGVRNLPCSRRPSGSGPPITLSATAWIAGSTTMSGIP